MKRLSHFLAMAVICCFAGKVSAQQGNYVFGLEGWAGYTSNGTVPFWLRSNQFGSVPLDGASLSLVGFARKEYDPGGKKLFDWGASFEGRANLGQGSNLTLIEGYGKMRRGIFELRAGRSKEITGICDTLFSSGSFSVSGNNLGIPKIELSIPDYFVIPWFDQLFAVKGNFSHGWMGKYAVRKDGGNEDTLIVNTFLHQKSIYWRFGKPQWNLKLYGGFNHQVMWGNEDETLNDDFTLSAFSTYLYVLIGKRFNNGSIQATRPGNHLGSLDFGLEYKFANLKLLVYRQNFYEAGALGHLANIQDGLNGISLERPESQGDKSLWNRIALEFLYTKNQARDLWLPVPMRYENYYNHYLYIQGWSYHGAALGSPMMTTRMNARADLSFANHDFFINNRIIAFNLGCEGSIKDFQYLLRTTWSRNYGTYYTAKMVEQSGLMANPGAYGFFGMQDQVSVCLEVNKELQKGLRIGCTTAVDSGELYYNSFGVLFKIAYQIYIPRKN